MAGMVLGFAALGVGIIHCAASVIWTAQWLGGGHLSIAQGGEVAAFWIVITAFAGGVALYITERLGWRC